MLTKEIIHKIFRLETDFNGLILDDFVVWNITSKKDKHAKIFKNGHKCIKYMGIYYKYDDIYNTLKYSTNYITKNSIVKYQISITLFNSKKFINTVMSQLNKYFKYNSTTNKFEVLNKEDSIKLVNVNGVDYIYVHSALYNMNEIIDIWKKHSIKEFKTGIESFKSIVQEYIEIDKYTALKLLCEFKQEIKISIYINDKFYDVKLIGVQLLHNLSPFIIKISNTNTKHSYYDIETANKIFINKSNAITWTYTYDEVLNMVKVNNEM